MEKYKKQKPRLHGTVFANLTWLGAKNACLHPACAGRRQEFFRTLSVKPKEKNTLWFDCAHHEWSDSLPKMGFSFGLFEELPVRTDSSGRDLYLFYHTHFASATRDKQIFTPKKGIKVPKAAFDIFGWSCGCGF